jgi:hypothetical protein
MAKVSPLQSSFIGGEASPLIAGRVDADRYKTLLSTCLNYIPIVQGPLVRRPGTRYVTEVKDSAKAVRLVAFEFSVTQAYIIEFGDQYVRFYRNNGQILSAPSVPYEVATPYLEADLFQLEFTQSADVLYITHPSYAPRKLTRTDHTAWTLTAITFLDGPYGATNNTIVTLTPSAFTGTGITITTGPISTITGAADNGSGAIRITDVAHGLVTGIRLRIAGVTGTTEANGNWTITVITANTYDLDGSVFVNAYAAGGTGHPIVFAAGDVGRLVRMQQGSVWGYARITAFTHEGLVTADVISTLTSTAAKLVWRLGIWSDTTGWPSCSTFYEDRLFFGTGQRLDGSASGDYELFWPTDTAGTVTASNAVSFTLNSNTVNIIRWIHTDERALIVGTVGEEWVVRPSTLNEALSPTNISAKPSTHYGSANVAPVQAGKATLFLQRAGRKMRELRYVYEVDGFQASDLTILSEHITVSGIKELAFQQEPQPLLWAVRNDGVLALLTYDRETDNLRAGWHRHIIGGFSDAAKTQAAVVESVAVIPSADSAFNEVWLVVRRYIDGAAKRYVEYFAPYFSDTDVLDDAYFVDCGLTYSGAPATVIAGLDHLEGETLAVLADGAPQPDVVVSGGSVTLPTAASTVQLGFGYNSDAQQMRLEAGAQDGTALGKTRRPHRCGFLVHRSLGLKIGTSFDALDEVTFRKAGDAMDTPPALFTGVVSGTIEADYDTEAQICWRQSQPLPSTILDVMPQLVTQDRG